MDKLIKWLKSNSFKFETNNLTNGGKCVFIKIFELSRSDEGIIYKHLKKVKLNYQYAGHYTYLRVDFQ